MSVEADKKRDESLGSYTVQNCPDYLYFTQKVSPPTTYTEGNKR